MTHLDLFIVLAASWLVAWFHKVNFFSILGLRPTRARMTHFGILIVATGLCCALGYVLRIYLAAEQYTLHPQLSPLHALAGLWDVTASVLIEEILFRGIGLVILIRTIGTRWAVIISAILFGLFHVFNASDNAPILFLYTFSMGLLLAYAFARTNSIWYPIAIHLGWNLTQLFIFPDGPYSNTILVLSSQPTVTVSYFSYYGMTFLPKIAALVVGLLLVRRFSPQTN